MPVPTMSAGSWEESQSIMSSVREMSGTRQSQGTRSQDDAMVGYFFQRPQTDAQMNAFPSKRWAVGDDSVIEQVGSICGYFSVISVSLLTRHCLLLICFDVKLFYSSRVLLSQLSFLCEQCYHLKTLR